MVTTDRRRLRPAPSVTTPAASPGPGPAACSTTKRQATVAPATTGRPPETRARPH